MLANSPNANSFKEIGCIELDWSMSPISFLREENETSLWGLRKCLAYISFYVFLHSNLDVSFISVQLNRTPGWKKTYGDRKSEYVGYINAIPDDNILYMKKGRTDDNFHICGFKTLISVHILNNHRRIQQAENGRAEGRRSDGVGWRSVIDSIQWSINVQAWGISSSAYLSFTYLVFCFGFGILVFMFVANILSLATILLSNIVIYGGPLTWIIWSWNSRDILAYNSFEKIRHNCL